MASPRVPAPSTATTSSVADPGAEHARGSAQASGSTVTASASLERVGRPGRAGSRGRPGRPSTSRRRCRRSSRSGCPGARWPKAVCSQSPVRSPAHTRAERLDDPGPDSRAPAGGRPGSRPRWRRRRPRSASVSSDADHLVAGDEGEAHERLEVAGAATVDRGEVGAADAREQRGAPGARTLRGARAGRRRPGAAGRPAPARPDPRLEASREAANRGRLRSKRSAFTVGPPVRRRVSDRWSRSHPTGSSRARSPRGPASTARPASPGGGRWRPAGRRG